LLLDAVLGAALSYTVEAHYYGHQLINTRSRYSLNARVETNGKTDTTFLASAVGRDVEVSRPA